MTITISRLYDNYSGAQQVVNDLEAAGLRSNDISIVANNSDNWYQKGTSRSGGAMTDRKETDRDGKDNQVESAEKGAGIGAVVGSAAGLLAGLGVIAIPGIGPVVAAGWLAATAAGAATVGAAGGVIGALTQTGVNKDDAHLYAEGIRRGGTLVTARVPDRERSRYDAVLDRSAVNIRQRDEAYRGAGWTGFEETAPPYSPAETRKERELHGSSGIGRPL